MLRQRLGTAESPCKSILFQTKGREMERER
jgi:hypothetical protein